MSEAKIVLYEGDPDEEVTIPARWEVCPDCQGRKKVPLQGIAFTQSDLDEAGPEFAEDYFGGHYDQPCTGCKGEGLVAVPDETRATPEQLQAYEDYERAEWEYRAEIAAERRAGC